MTFSSAFLQSAPATSYPPNPYHPKWHFEYLRVDADHLFLHRTPPSRPEYEAETSLVRIPGDPQESFPDSFVGHHTVISNQGPNHRSKHELVFGTRTFHALPPADKHADDFLIVEFQYTSANLSIEEKYRQANEAITVLKAIRSASPEITNAEFRRLQSKLDIRIHHCPGETAKLTIYPILKLEPSTVDLAALEKRRREIRWERELAEYDKDKQILGLAPKTFWVTSIVVIFFAAVCGLPLVFRKSGSG